MFLDLQDCAALEQLPDDLALGSYLWLPGCKSLRTLPKGLKLGGDLNLCGCEAWDGIVPEDAVFGGAARIHTDQHPSGVEIAAFRRMGRMKRQAVALLEA